MVHLSFQLITLSHDQKKLLDAIKNDDGWKVQLILNSGVIQKINFCDEDGQTTLHHAVQGGNILMMERLLQKGANPNYQNNYGITPTLFAAHQTVEILELLLAWGGDIFNRAKEGGNILSFAIQSEFNDVLIHILENYDHVDVNSQDKNGDTILHQLQDDEEAIEKAKIILKMGADRNIKNNKSEFAKVLNFL